MKTPELSRRAALAWTAAAVAAPGTVLGQATQPDAEGGIGGTGIVGVLTDFGSLIVAGNSVRTDGGTRYSNGFGALRETALQVGDSLTVEATGPENGLLARRVHVTYPLVGAISAVREGGRLIVVNGADVRLDGALRQFGTGDRVAVSGLWRGTQVQASRIAPAPSALDLVSGDVTRDGGRMRVGSVPVRGPGTGSPARGSFASIVGRFDAADGVMTAREVSTARFLGAAGPLVRLSVEGYLAPSSEAPGFRVSGLGHSFERNLKLAQFAGTRVLMNGGYTGRFAAEGAVVLPEGFGAQRRLLRRLSAQSR
jgi:hypothetical protein